MACFKCEMAISDRFIHLIVRQWQYVLSQLDWEISNEAASARWRHADSWLKITPCTEERAVSKSSVDCRYWQITHRADLRALCTGFLFTSCYQLLALYHYRVWDRSWCFASDSRQLWRTFPPSFRLVFDMATASVTHCLLRTDFKRGWRHVQFSYA